MKTNPIEKKAAKDAANKLDDIKLYRLMIEFALAMVALLLIITAGNNEIFTLLHVMPIFLAVSGVLFGASAVYFCIKRAKHIDETEKIITSAGLFGNAAALFFLSAAFYLFMNAQLVICAIIALAVAYMAYNVEGRGFFAYSAITAASYISLLLVQCDSYYALGTVIAIIAQVLTFALPALGIVLACVLLTRKNGVSLFSIRIESKKLALAMLVTFLIALLCAVLLFVYPVSVTIATYVMLAVYFIVTVIGIFKMM